MKTLRRIINLVLLAAVASAVPAFAVDVTVYAYGSDCAYGTLNLNTGILTSTGTLPCGQGDDQNRGLGDFGGNLYIDAQYFFQVFPTNGSVTEIGNGAVFCRELGSTTPGMYCLDNSTNKILYSVSPINGMLTQIGTGTGLPSGGQYIALSADASELYVTETVGSGSVLYSLDTLLTGLATEIGPVMFNGTPRNVLSMVYTHGQLYAASNNEPACKLYNNGAIYTLNTANGTASIVTCTNLWAIGMNAGPISTFTYKKLHDFTAGSDGATPLSGLTMDSGGNLYGTAYAGGAGYGTAYQLLNSGTSWSFSPIYTFAGGNDGQGPASRVVFGPNGGLYGTTTHGGDGTGDCTFGYTGCGTVFNLKRQPCRTAPACAWSETLLYQFQGNDDGYLPYQADLTFDQAGNIYGTTVYGGLNGDHTCSERYNCGTVYELTKSGNTWKETLLHSFDGNSQDGGEPYSGVIFDKAGNLYGTTYAGGGAVYQLAPSNGAWSETVLLDGNNHGCCGYLISAGLIFDSEGNLYGAAFDGGNFPTGFVFKLTGGDFTFSDLYDFDGDFRAAGPYSTLVMDKAGNLYGTTKGLAAVGDYGTVFKLTPYNGRYYQTVLYRFSGGADGAIPYGNLTMDANGNLYGTASAGGAGSACTGGCGVVFEITPN